MNQSLSIERLPVPLLQLLGPLRDKFLHLLVLGAEFGVDIRLAFGKILLLGVQRGLVLGPSGLGCSGQALRRLLGLLDVGQLHGELHVALGQLALGSFQLLASLAEPSLYLREADLEVLYVSNVSIIFDCSMLYYILFWTLMGFILHFYIILGLTY